MWAEVDFDSNQTLTEIDRTGFLSKNTQTQERSSE